jgi:hypothetical protein
MLLLSECFAGWLTEYMASIAEGIAWLIRVHSV